MIKKLEVKIAEGGLVYELFDDILQTQRAELEPMFLPAEPYFKF
jgi:hypothetical protein